MQVDLVNIHKHFGAVQACDDISLHIGSGTIQGLLGENGAGKTTLMKILSGYQSCDDGKIILDGHAVQFRSPAEAIAAGIGMLHQDPLDIPALSVLDNFVLGRRRELVPKRNAYRHELHSWCQHLELGLDPDATVSGLTVGERQQLEMVRLLSLGVRVIILDEPTTGISAPQRVRLFQTLRQLADEGLAVIFVSHKLDEVEQLCSQATVLRMGRLAGAVRAPFSADELICLMFGQALGPSVHQRVVPGEVVLQLDNVAVHTYRLQVNRMCLQVRQGQVLGLAGLEGSGQQVMMRACAGLQQVTSGHLYIAGREMTHQPYHRFLDMGVALVPAARLEEGIVAGLTLREHVALTTGGRGLMIDWPAADERAGSMIRAYNVVGQPETMVQELSGGNQQRALLALLPDDLRLLILEHPTRGLDVESTRWVWTMLLRRREQGTAIIFTSTDIDELMEHSDLLAVFSGGVMAGPVEADNLSREELGSMIGGKSQ
jgi:ABC-type uncharacterized transport system ATPase subunit